MNKSEIAVGVAGQLGMRKSWAKYAVDAVLAPRTEVVPKDKDVRVVGFGTFTTRSHRGRSERNPRKRETLTIPAAK